MTVDMCSAGRQMLSSIDVQHRQIEGLMAERTCAQGWRFVFLIMSALALTVTVLVLVFGVEPRSLKARRKGEEPRAGRGGVAAVLAGLRAMVTSLLITEGLVERGSVKKRRRCTSDGPNNGCKHAVPRYTGCLPAHRERPSAGPG